MLQDKVAIVMGGSGGLGSSIAVTLGEYGAKVAVVYHKNFQSAASAADQVPLSFIQSVDVTDEHQIRELMLDVRRVLGGIDILVNSAGIYDACWSAAIDLQDWERVLRVNLTGTFLTCKHALPYMVKQKYGRIINISSFTGRDALAGTAAYSASKAGIVALTKVIGTEYAKERITANVVSPGVFDAGMVDLFDCKTKEMLRKKVPSKALGNPKELAEMVAFLASKQASYVNRQVIGVDGGI